MFDVKIKVDLKDLEKLTQAYPGASRRARLARLTEAVSLLEREITKLTPYGAGPIHLRDTIHGAVKTQGERLIGIVGTPAEYGEPVEMGTKPHFPPLGPIEFWVERKLRIAQPEAGAVAFLIARAIAARGTKGAKMFETGFKEQEARVEQILRQIPGDIVREVSS